VNFVFIEKPFTVERMFRLLYLASSIETGTYKFWIRESLGGFHFKVCGGSGRKRVNRIHE
jgi:hypothetical protein